MPLPSNIIGLVGVIEDGGQSVALQDNPGATAYGPTKDELWRWFKQDISLLNRSGYKTVYDKNEPPGDCIDAYYRIVIAN